ncbi:ribosome silencing factor [Peptococcus simiae]|uniref:ribosome silencing factor n=1 Tax=Peptococcus simiae TaxID=1643805 RepID=UPI003980410D
MELELKSIVQTLDQHKGEDIKVLEIGALSSIGDYFVLVTALNNTHAQALAHYVEEVFKADGQKPLRIEGLREGTWILMDYGDIIVHIFTPEERSYYGLEKLWGDAEELATGALTDGPSEEQS